MLNKLPRTLQARAKSDLHEIWMSPTRVNADKAFDDENLEQPEFL